MKAHRFIHRLRLVWSWLGLGLAGAFWVKPPESQAQALVLVSVQVTWSLFFLVLFLVKVGIYFQLDRKQEKPKQPEWAKIAEEWQELEKAYQDLERAQKATQEQHRQATILMDCGKQVYQNYLKPSRN